MDEPKKIPVSQVEVIGTHGEVVKEATDSPRDPFSAFGAQTKDGHVNSPFGQMKVIKGGPWLLLLLPILIPVIIIGFFLILLLTLLFGRGMFKIFSRNLRTR